MRAKSILSRALAVVASAGMILSSTMPVMAETISADFGTFTNIYSAPEGTASIEAKKVLTGKDLTAGEFSFELKDADGTTLQTKKNDAEGKIVFDDITYKEIGTHTYKISEVAGTESGVTYDTTVYTVTVDVKETKDETDGSSKLAATVSYDATPEFHNSYSPASATIRATKTLDGKDLEKDEFTFELRDASGSVVQTAKNAANGQVIFEAIEYEKAGAYDYVLAEVPGTEAGVTYDTTTYPVRVTVESKDGALAAAVTYKVSTDKDAKYETTEPTFKNTFASSSAVIKATKELEGRDLKANEFEFELKDEDGEVVDTAKNAADGTVTFDSISYSKAGTYKYTIVEKSNGLANVTYDQSEFTATVTVEKKDGKLTTKVEYSTDPVFKNTYTEPTDKSVKVQVTAKKELTGRDLRAGEFHFTLTSSSGKVLDTITNNASGDIIFQNLTFYKAGTYTYYIAEVQESNVNMTYDSSVYEVVITVTADKNGKLSATVEGNDPTFKNVYNAKSSNTTNPTNTTPDSSNSPDHGTGDSSNFMLWVGLTLMGIGILLYLYWKKWKDG